MSLLTLGEASKLTGKSKPTISNAVKSGKVTGTKGADGVFQIEKSELIRVYPEKGSTANTPKSKSAGKGVAELENKHLAEQVADLQARLSKTEDKLETAEIREREANARVFALIEDKTTKSLWKRLRGK